MKLYCALLLVAFVAWSADAKKFSCEQSDSSTVVKSFDNTGVRTSMPCKYNALRRQECGAYTVTLSPGLITVGNQYRLNTLWLGVEHATGTWMGRTTNKKAVKFFNNVTTELFTKKQGSLNDILNFTKDARSTMASPADNSFTVKFYPWDPDSELYKKSWWTFHCNTDEGGEILGYPAQVCGATKDDGFKRNNKKGDGNDDGMTPDQMFLYNVFMDTDADITQVDDQCLDVESTMQNSCTGREKEAIITCAEIITPIIRKKGGRSNKSKCINKYSCSPMHVFVDCVKWVCSGYTDDAACESVAEATDMCSPFKVGNLTQKIEDANCYRDYLTIIDPEDDE